MLGTIKNSKNVYYTNGDIILLSLPKNNVATAFKVDRVFLLRASPVFEDMLSLPPTADVEIYDNVPLVRLQDEAHDLMMFLKALYDPRCIPWKKHDLITPRTVEGILLLANKYQADSLRERIVGLLETDWPTKLFDWDMNEAEINSKAEASDFIRADLIPEPCAVIRLARKCNVPSILPAAFYHLSRIRATSDRHLPDLLEEELLEDRDELVAEFSLLSAEDYRRLIVGRAMILDVFHGYLWDALVQAQQYKHPPSDAGKCGQGMINFHDALELEVLRYYADPLSLMSRETSRPVPGTCDACRNYVFLRALNSKRETLWKQLPSLFMLDCKE